ncbi:hypothetical protein EDF68_103315 [Ochrobactrum sp. BH3]|nr:hypothetical protein EDF68_103315 [Ochrobactrum sp. BH3]
MRHVILIAALLTATSAQADESFQTAVFKCWNAPAGIEKTSRFVMSVEIDDKGEPIDITAKEYQKSRFAKEVGKTLQRAIVRCAPYRQTAGVYTITIDKSTFGGKSLDPFK